MDGNNNVESNNLTIFVDKMFLELENKLLFDFGKIKENIGEKLQKLF